MKVVLDAGVVFTALTGFDVTKKILFLKDLELYAPKQLHEEINEHLLRIQEISSLSYNEIIEVLKLIENRINFIPVIEFVDFLQQANDLLADKEDTNYLALALYKKIPIWSNDEDFKEQSVTPVFNTKELVDELKLWGIEFE